MPHLDPLGHSISVAIDTPPASTDEAPAEFCALDSAQLVARTGSDAVPTRSLRSVFSGEGLPPSRVQDRKSCMYDEQLDWMVVLALPNPAFAPDIAVSAEQAECVFTLCFREDDARGEIGLSSRSRMLDREMMCFREVFMELPDHHSGKGKNYGLWAGKPASGSRSAADSECSDTSSNTSQSGNRPRCFLELLRNVIMAKLVLYCGLRVQMVRNEESIFLMISCTPLDLLREADRTHLSTELDTLVVDPQSLEPCTDMFYPLADWYTNHRGLSTDFEITTALEAALMSMVSSLEDAPQKIRRRHEQVLSFLKRGIEVKSPAVFLRGGSRVKKFSSSSLNSENSNNPMGSFLSRMSSSLSEARIAIAETLKRFFPAWEQRHALSQRSSFLNFLALRAAAPLRRADRIASEVAVEGGTRLRNFYDVLGTDRISMYRAFEVGSYLGDRSHPWVWRHYGARTKAAPGVQGRYIAVPFTPHQAISLVKSILERQVLVERLIVMGLATSLFPLDARNKFEEPSEWVEDVDVVDGKFDRPYYWNTVSGEWREKDPTDGIAVKATAMAECWRIPDKPTLGQFLMSFTKSPPVDAIRNYYGESVALYFAFACHLCLWCVPPAVLGVVTTIVNASTTGQPRAVMNIVYSIAIACWGTICMEFWNRMEAKLALMWGTSGISARSNICRPAFNGYWRRSPVDFNDYDQYDVQCCFHDGALGRVPRRLVSYFCVLILLLVHVSVLALLMEVNARWTKENWYDMNKYSSITIGTVLGTFMMIFSSVVERVNMKLTGWENHRTDHGFLHSSVLKLCVMEFVSQFGFYFYVGFLKGIIQGCAVWDKTAQAFLWKEPAPIRGLQDFGDMFCTEELGYYVQLVFPILMVSNLVELVGFRWLEVVIDTVRFRRSSSTQRSVASMYSSQIRDSALTMADIISLTEEKEEYNSINTSGSTQDYLELAILFGHTSLFSVVFPLAPLLTFLLLVIELRVDGHKLFYNVRRPFPMAVESIGPWRVVLQCTTWLAVLTNSLLTVWGLRSLDSGVFGDFSAMANLLFFVLMVLCLVVFKMLIIVLVPDVPARIEVLMQHFNWVNDSLNEENLTVPLNRQNAQLDRTVYTPDQMEDRDAAEFAVNLASMWQRSGSLIANASRYAKRLSSLSGTTAQSASSV